MKDICDSLRNSNKRYETLSKVQSEDLIRKIEEFRNAFDTFDFQRKRSEKYDSKVQSLQIRVPLQE